MEKKCKICNEVKDQMFFKVDKNWEDLVDIPHRNRDICLECNNKNKINTNIIYKQKNPEKWKLYLNEYQKKYKKNPINCLRACVSQLIVKKKKEGNFIMPEEIFCPILNKNVEKKDLVVVLDNRIFDEIQFVNFKMKEIGGWENLKKYLVITSRQGKLKLRVNPSVKRQKEKKRKFDLHNNQGDLTINKYNLTYLFYIQNKKYPNNRLNELIISDEEIRESQLVKIYSKYYYKKTTMKTIDYLIANFEINEDNFMEKEKQLYQNIFEYIKNNTDELFANTIMPQFTYSLKKMLLKFYLKKA